MLTINRTSLKTYTFTSSEPKEMKVVKDALSIWVEGANFSDAYKKGWWDGYNKFYQKDNSFEVGLLDEVEFNLKDNKIDHKIIEQDFRKIKIEEYVLGSRLRQHQKESVESFFKKNLG